MSIPNYLRPQMTIKQILDQTEFAANGTLNAIIIGGKYLLSRYGSETLPQTAFDAAGSDLAYKYTDSDGAPQEITNEIVDTDSVKVYITDGRVKLAEFDDDPATEVIEVAANSTPHVLQMMDTSYFAGTGLATEFDSRDTAVGDVVTVYSPAQLAYDGETGGFAVGEVVTAASGGTGTIRAIQDNGTDGILYLTGVTGTFAEDDALTGDITGAADVAAGGLLSPETTIERKVIALQSSTGSTASFDQVVLDGPAVDTSVDNESVELDVTFYLDYTGEVASTNYTADGTDVTYDAGATYDVPGRAGVDVAFEDGVGTLSVSFRAVIPSPASESYRSYSSTSEIIEDAGPIDLDNPYAYALSRALKGAQGLKVYGVSVASEDDTGYSAAFDKISHTDSVYALCVLSSDADVRSALVSHVDEMSGELKKNFRRAYVGTDSPGAYAVLEKEDDNTNLLVTAAAYGGPGGDVRLITIEGSAPSLVGLVKADYELRIGSATYIVEQVISSTEVLLKTGTAYPTAGPNQVAEFWAPDTARTQADYLIDEAQALSSRRVSSVWVEDGTATVGGAVRSISSQFVAAEIAGLRSAVSPHIALTRTEITTVANAPSMYTRYSPELLDEIAAAGTFVVTQDAESGAVYIRHQLTTEVDKGALYYEDSVGVNIDDICLSLKYIEQKYIGKKNATLTTISEIKAEVFDNLFARTQAVANNPDGPALVAFDDLEVGLDPIYKDTINVTVTVFVGLPLNRIAITVTGSIQLDA